MQRLQREKEDIEIITPNAILYLNNLVKQLAFSTRQDSHFH